MGQRANISAQAHIVGVASPIDVADPTTNTDIFAASKRSVAQAIADNMGSGSGADDGVVDSVTLSRSGRNLTATLGRSVGADLTDTVQLPEDENDNRFADSLGVLVTGNTLTVTIGRTAPLPDLVDTATLPTGGGGGTDTNDYADSLGLSLVGQDLTVTVGRTGSLADLTDTITLPTGGGGGADDGVADSVALALSGQDLTVTVGLTVGADLTDTITLPTSGGGGGATAGRTLIGTIAATNAQTATTLTLDEALEETTHYRATLTDASGTVSTADFFGAELLGLTEQATPPTSDDNALILSLARPGTLTGSAGTVVRIWMVTPVPASMCRSLGAIPRRSGSTRWCMRRQAVEVEVADLYRLPYPSRA